MHLPADAVLLVRRVDLAVVVLIALESLDVLEVIVELNDLAMNQSLDVDMAFVFPLLLYVEIVKNRVGAKHFE